MKSSQPTIAIRFACLATSILMLAIPAAAPAADDAISFPQSNNLERIRNLDLAPLRAAIDDLTATFGIQYRHGSEFLDRLQVLEDELTVLRSNLDSEDRTTTAPEETAKAAAALLERFDTLEREALIANPLVSGRSILFVVRQQYRKDHHNTATIFQTGEINTASFTGGGALKTIDFGRNGKVITLREFKEGVIRDPDVHFSGEKIVFSLRRSIDEDYSIHEISADGSKMWRLTTTTGVADIDSFYLPDDSIAFSSTREPKYCMCNRHIMANLFRMDGDGANILQIGKSTLFEGHGSLLPDGRILYDRWEYVDRNFGDAQGLWTVNPDGTNHAVYFGNNTSSPGGVIDARAIPGTQQAVCILGSCHDRPWGAMAVIDRRRALDGREAVVRTWPPQAVDLVGKGDWDTFMQVDPRYEDPWPLNDKYFLCARTVGRGEQTGIFLADVFGNEILLHHEEPGCFDPMPLGPRPRPPVIPVRRTYDHGAGVFYVADVYEGTGMEKVPRGMVKSLRVIESPEKRTWTHAQWGGQGVHCPAMNWHDFNNKRILGTVPVEADGSAHFVVPAEKFVYFQLLDEKGMMIHSMRSGTMVQPGETTGCVGCHEGRRTSPPPAGGRVPLAVQRPPSRLEGWYGEARLFSYMDEVQPVFDRACVRCHDYGREAGRTLNLARDRTSTFNTAYNELWRRKMINVVGAGPAPIQAPYSWGSHASRIVEKILVGAGEVPEHADVRLSPEDFDRIVTWIDINAPFYPTYSCAYPDNLAGRSPLDAKQLARLEALTGEALSKWAAHNSNQGPRISFDRPELSPCLAKIADKSSPGYAEALAIIQAGAAQLAKRPRADMAGFNPCPTDRQREKKYLHSRLEEIMSRAALHEGNMTIKIIDHSELPSHEKRDP